MSPSHRPPSLLEIVGLPVVGAIAVEALRTPKNELILFFLPFAIAALRLFIAQFQVPPRAGKAADNPQIHRILRACIAFNQLAVFVLILFEGGVIIAGGDGTPREVWAVVAAILGLYVALRLVSRRYWIQASEATTSESPTRVATGDSIP